MPPPNPINPRIYTTPVFGTDKMRKYKIRQFEIEARGLQSVADAATA
jgi:hypothetical protein